jgi:hypothetical protein
MTATTIPGPPGESTALEMTAAAALASYCEPDGVDGVDIG